MTIEENIEAALFARVGNLALSPPLPIAWPNVEFPGDGNDMPASYLRVVRLPNRSMRYAFKGTDPVFRKGILQITVVVPLGAGAQSATSIVGAVAAHFPADLALYSEGVKVTIGGTPDEAAGIPTDTSWEVPLSIPYELFA